jgi:replicative DNA helicase
MGKGISVAEKLPTPTGYKLAGKIQVGDYLFGSNGKPTKVTFVSEVHNLPCYRVHFNDHTSLLTDSSHQWSVYEKADRESLTPQVMTSEDMYYIGTKTKDRRNRFAIPLAQPLAYATKNLPVHPYALGLWLGDGTAREACITVGTVDRDAIIQQLAIFGVATVVKKLPDERTFNVRFSDGNRKKPRGSSVQAKLRELGLLNNKHIPSIYMFADIQQRIDLLRGLMDSDGSGYDKSPIFYNSNLSLCESVLELVHSLGGRGYITNKTTTLNGRTFFTYKVIFQLPFSSFYLQRKRQNERFLQSPYRYITKIEREESTPTVCFQVEAADSLYVVGTACIVTHNTWLLVYQAHHIWKEERVPVVFVTKEMTPQAIRQRFDAIECKLSYDALRRGMLSPYHEEVYQTKLNEIANDEVPFIILGYSLDNDTSTVSSLIPKVERYLSDGGVLFVDGLYLMDDDRGDEDWKRVVNIARDLKLLALQYKIPVVATTQAQIQENKSYIPDISNIAYGKYIAQYVDALLSQSQNPQQKIAEIMYLNILAQREGDIGSFPINFRFDPLDFSQKAVTVIEYDDEGEGTLL